MTLQIKEEYVEIYQALQENIDDVVREHALKQVKQRIIEAEQRIKQWEANYILME